MKNVQKYRLYVGLAHDCMRFLATALTVVQLIMKFVGPAVNYAASGGNCEKLQIAL